MKKIKLTVCLFFSLVSLTTFSQKVYFVYLQSENDQAFYVRMNTVTHSSSASGYCILSKLRDSIYNFTIGFPQGKWREQSFSVTMNKKDHGYLLKNFGEKGWGLFDLQTLSVQMAASGSAKIEDKKNEENKDVSVFTEILSKAADDPSLKDKPAQPKVEEKKVEIVNKENVAKVKPVELAKDTIAIKPVEIAAQPVVKKDEPKIDNKVQTEIKKVEEPEVKVVEMVTPPAEPFKPTLVTKRSESSTTEGFGLVFVDNLGNGENDTIRLLIPNPQPVITEIKEEPKEEKRFIDILPDTVKKKEEKVVEEIPVIKENPVEKNVLKNNCPAVAEESDFFKLRKNMAATEGDDGMLTEAKNYFKIKCFSTEQIKNLALLFLNDAGKYKFFDLAYTYVTDTDKFGVLQNELKEEYYINRFKAMLRN